MHGFLDVENDVPERGHVLWRHFHEVGFPLRAVRIPQVHLSALRIESHRYGLNGNVTAAGDRDVHWGDLQLVCVYIRRFQQSCEKLRASNRKEQRRNIKTNDERYGKSRGQHGKRAELALVDLLAETHMFRAVERILDKEMHECGLFGLRFMNRLDRTDKAVFEPWILLFDKTRELGIRRCPPQRQDQRFDYSKDKCRDKA